MASSYNPQQAQKASCQGAPAVVATWMPRRWTPPEGPPRGPSTGAEVSDALVGCALKGWGVLLAGVDTVGSTRGWR